MIQKLIDALLGFGQSILQKINPESDSDLLVIYTDIEVVLPKVAFLLTNKPDNFFGNFFLGKYKSLAFYIYGRVYYLSNTGIKVTNPREYMPTKHELAIITPLSSVLDLSTWKAIEKLLIGFSTLHYTSFGHIIAHLIFQVRGACPTALLPLYDDPHTFYRKIVMDNNFWVVKLFSCKA